MSKLLAIHSLKGPTKAADIDPIAKSVKAHTSSDAYWVKSWLQMNDQGDVTKILCEWDADDPKKVARILKESAPDLPLDGVFAMGEIQSESYR